MRNFTRKEAHDLGLKYVMDLLETSSPFGRAHKRTLVSYGAHEERGLRQELSRTKELSEEIARREEDFLHLQEVLSELRDIRKTVLSLKEGLTLSELDLFEIKYLVRKIHEIRERGKGFFREEESPMEMEEVLLILDPDETGLSTFHLYDSYDPRLPEIRGRKRHIEKLIRLGGSEEEISELLKERRKVVLEEEETDYAVRKSLTEALLPYAEELLLDMDILGRLDFLLAKAKVAQKFRCVVPEVGQDLSISMTEGFHPYFEHLLSKREKPFVRVTLSLKPGSTVITGANMGGKSITLKTLFLNTLLIQMGILPFAESMKTPILGSMHLLAEDQENPDKGLSSFGGEVVRIRDILDEMKETPSLLVLDEPFRGTNPQEGKAMTGGLINHFRNSHHFLLMATHHDLSLMENIHRYQVRGLKNVDLMAYMDAPDELLRSQVGRLSELMDYTLEKWDGSETLGDAVRIAEFLGLSKELTTEIRKLLK